MATIQGVYVALFGRPADPLGLAYWKGVTNDGANLSAIGDLAQTQEYQDRFAGQSNAQVVNAIFQSLFNRSADVAGLTYWVNGLNSGEFTINDVAIRILDGAQGSDKTAVETKVAAADLYTASIDTTEEIIAYDGNAAAAAGRAFLAGVTTSVPTQAQVDAAVATMVGQGGVPGDTFTLTTGVDTLVGTANNDTFQAVLDGAATNTVNTFDSVDGGAGRDTLLIGGAGGVAIPANVTIKNIEVVNIATTNAITNLNSASFQGVEEIWQIGVTGAVTVGAGVTAGFRNIAASTVTAADGVDSVSVALDGVPTGGTVVVSETTAGDVTSVTVSGKVAGAGAVTVDTAANTTAVDTVNLDLTSNGVVTLTVDNAVVTTVDASGSTGNLTINASAIAALETFNGGSGNDVLTFDNNVLTGETITIDAGAGVDIINYAIDFAAAGVAASLTGGAGGDTFVFTTAGAGNLFAAADSDDLTESLITITDFDASEDVIDISGVLAVGAARVANNVVNNAIAAADVEDLFDVVTAVAGVTADDNYAVFSYEGTTYIYAETAAGNLGQGDTLIALTGISVADLSAANFIV